MRIPIASVLLTACLAATPSEAQESKKQPVVTTAKSLIRCGIRNPGSQKLLGNVIDLTLTDNVVTAMTIGMGGFLGIGELNRVISIGDVRIGQDKCDITTTITRETLLAAPQAPTK